MTRRTPTASQRGAVATGATAAGAASLGALAMGAMALGAIAVGALAVGRLTVGRARLRRVEIGELAVGRLDVGAFAVAGALTAVARIRAAEGKGDALERLILDQMAAGGPGAPTYRAHRSGSDPDVFLVASGLADDTGGDRPADLDALLRRAARQGLVAAADDPVELYRSI